MENYTIISEYRTDKNVDRVKFISQDGHKFILAACYHLENQIKTGSLHLLSTSNELLFTTSLNYGVLDIKQSGTLLYSTNSNSSFSTFEFKSDKHTISETNNIIIESKDKQNTCNTLDLNKNLALLAMNDGYFHLYDLTSGTFTESKQAHSYGLWSCMFYDDNTFLTGSEDSLLKLWDLRDNSSCKVNKTHSASVNTIQKSLLNDYQLLTGSYDECLRVIDIRKFEDVVFKHKECTIWDFKQVVWDGKLHLFTTCVYDGFKVFELDGDFSGVNVIKGPGLHESIVYGVDVKEMEKDVLVLSCSFYDNRVLYWKYAKNNLK
jgi:WD40 repeat protein